jgi:two-component SAPR family response regulator
VSTPGEKSLVIIDDEVAYLVQLKEVLTSRLGREVHTFESGQAALDALPNLDPGMIVTDYYMPHMNGIEFIQKAVKVKPECAFIIITGHGPSLVSRNLPHIPQLKCFLNKPVRWRTLAIEVCRHWSGTPRPEFKE